MLDIHAHFFKKWTPNMAYVLGFIVADGCIISTRKDTSYILNITSVDYDHLEKIKNVLCPSGSISKKTNGHGKIGYQIQVRNQVLTSDLLKIGIKPRKSYNQKYFDVPDKFFSHFARGFFDGDGTVYIYTVNGTPQIKAGFVGASKNFLSEFNKKLSAAISIPKKRLHTKVDKRGKRATTYYLYYYISDCEKLAKLFYQKSLDLYLERKKDVFDIWKDTLRRKYIKKTLSA